MVEKSEYPSGPILITGANGQLGREFEHQFRQKNLAADSFIPYSSSELDIINTIQLNQEFDARQPSVIINCAAYTAVDDAETNREQAKMVNAEGVKNIADYCHRNDVLLVHFSTDYIFAGTADDATNFAKGYAEDHPAEPVNYYGQTKWQGEQAIVNSGCRHLIIRVSWLCGRFGNNFVKSMMRLGAENDHLSVVDDQRGSPTFTAELVEAVKTLLAEEQEGVFHFSSDGIISWADFAEHIFDQAGIDTTINRIPSSEYPTKAARPQFSKLNTAKVNGVKGISTQSWKQGLAQLMADLHHQPE